MLIPVVAALIALVAALAGYTMVKFFGVDLPRPAARGQACPRARRRALGARRHGLARARLRRARPAADPVHPGHRPGDAPARRRRASADTVAAGGWLLAPVERRARELRPGHLPARRRRELRARLRCSCAGSTTAGCAAPPPWACGYPVADRAHAGHAPKASASRSGRSSSRSSACSASCPRPSTPQPRYRVVGRGPLLALALPADRRRRRAQLARLVGLLQQGRIAVYLLYSFVTLIAMLLAGERDERPRARSRSCSRSSSRCCSRRCSSAGSTSGAPGCRTSSAPRAAAAVPRAAQAVQQGVGGRRARLAAVPRRALHRLRLHGARLLDHPDAVDRPAAVAGRRRDRAGRAVRAGARLHLARRRWTSAPPSARWARGARC